MSGVSIPISTDSILGSVELSAVKDNIFSSIGNFLIAGGDLSIDVDPTKFDISAGSGNIVVEESPGVYTMETISWPTTLAIPVPDIGTATAVLVYIDKDLNIIQSTFEDDTRSVDVRSYISLGTLLLTATQIDLISNSSLSACGVRNSDAFMELATSIGDITVNGLKILPAANDLTFKKTAGTTFASCFNYKNLPNNPSFDTKVEQNPCSYLSTWRDGSGGWVNYFVPQTNIIPGVYDDGTGGVTAPTGNVTNNNWQVMLIYDFGNLCILEYGQELYSNKTDALAAANLSTDVNPLIESLPLRCKLVVRGGASDLSVQSDAAFVETNKFNF